MSAMGIKSDQFELPICYSFQAKILNDQLCYEVDLNRFADKNNPSEELKLGFNFLMDYNEDRQVIFEKSVSTNIETGLVSSIIGSEWDGHASIYLNTVGKYESLRRINENTCKHYLRCFF